MGLRRRESANNPRLAPQAVVHTLWLQSFDDPRPATDHNNLPPKAISYSAGVDASSVTALLTRRLSTACPTKGTYL